MFERPDFWAILIESLTEAVRQGATGWTDDDLRLVRSWPFGLDEIGVEVRLYHGEEDVRASQACDATRRGLTRKPVANVPGRGTSLRGQTHR